jgi:hypothetical protein
MIPFYFLTDSVEETSYYTPPQNYVYQTDPITPSKPQEPDTTESEISQASQEDSVIEDRDTIQEVPILNELEASKDELVVDKSKESQVATVEVAEKASNTTETSGKAAPNETESPSFDKWLEENTGIEPKKIEALLMSEETQTSPE